MSRTMTVTRKNPMTAADHDLLEAQFGARLATALTLSSHNVAPDIAERLRFAREQALARARGAAVTEPVVGLSAGAAVLGQLGAWWPRLGALLPVLALAAGLLLVGEWKASERARAAAEIDAVLLADQLPPAAYADAGFVAFLKLAQP